MGDPMVCFFMRCSWKIRWLVRSPSPPGAMATTPPKNPPMLSKVPSPKVVELYTSGLMPSVVQSSRPSAGAKARILLATGRMSSSRPFARITSGVLKVPRAPSFFPANPSKRSAGCCSLRATFHSCFPVFLSKAYKAENSPGPW